MRRLYQIISAATILLIMISATISCVPTGNTAKVSSGDIDALRSSLEKNDFALKLAPFIHVDLIELYEAGKLANAAGNNANAPYRGVFAALPDNIEIKDLKQLSGAQDKIHNYT